MWLHEGEWKLIDTLQSTPLTPSIQRQDGTPLDTSVFTVTTSASSISLTVESSDASVVGDYLLRFKGEYVDLSNAVTHDFTVSIVLPPCDIDETELYYKVASGSVTRPAFLVDSSCTPTRSITQVDVSKGGVTVSLPFITNDATTLTIDTSDLSFLGEYLVEVMADDFTTAYFTFKVWTWCDDW